MTRLGIPLAAAILAASALTGCFTSSDDGDSLKSVSLSATRLAGRYTLKDYLFEYGNGVRYDPSNLPLTGTLAIGADSGYLEIIVLDGDTTPTQGRIVQVKAAGEGNDRGELLLTLEDADSSASGKSAFAFRHDTLVLVTEVSKARDASKQGFKETAYYLRDPGPALD